MSAEFLKAELETILRAVIDEVDAEYREEASEFLKQAGSDLASQAWKAKTAKTELGRDQALDLIEDVKLQAELLAAELYLDVADRADKKFQEIRERLISAVRIAGGVLKTSIKYLGPLLV